MREGREIDDQLASSGLLSFYDRLRQRVAAAVERRGGRLGRSAAAALLLAPDLLVMLVRLTLDREVPQATRSLVAGALAYFILPVDLLPEAVVGVGGFLDDVVLAAMVLNHVLSGEMGSRAARHWSGSQGLRVVLRDLGQGADALLGQGLHGRLRKLLGKRGIEV